MARSRISSGARAGIRSSRPSISSVLSTRGRWSSRFGLATRSAGFAATSPLRSNAA